jgi:hypothetical protein
MAAGEKAHGKGKWRICQVDLRYRVKTNPVAKIFGRRMLEPIQAKADAVTVSLDAGILK